MLSINQEEKQTNKSPINAKCWQICVFKGPTIGIFRSSNKIHIHGVFQTPQLKEHAQSFEDKSECSEFRGGCLLRQEKFSPSTKKICGWFLVNEL